MTISSRSSTIWLLFSFAKNFTNDSAIISPTPSISTSSSIEACLIFSRSFENALHTIFAFDSPIFAMPRLYINFAVVVIFAVSAAFTSFSYDFSPNPSIDIISSLYLLSLKRSASSCKNPFDMNFSMVASDIPSMFIASRLTKSDIDLIFFARQSGFSQNNTSTSFSLWMDVFSPHTGHLSGIAREPLFVRFCAI